MHALIDKLSATPGPGGLNYLSILPDFSNNWDLAVAIFIMPIAVQWWAVWYPGAEPGGGSYIAQRMLASRSERDSLGAVLFFNVAHYVLRPWPWILVGLASIIVYPELSDIQRAFPNLDPRLIGRWENVVPSGLPGDMRFATDGSISYVSAYIGVALVTSAHWRVRADELILLYPEKFDRQISWRALRRNVDNLTAWVANWYASSSLNP